MYNPRFTSDPRRIARLQANYEEGKMREKLPLRQRERLDVTALTVSEEELRFLFQNALTSSQRIRLEKRELREQ